MTTPTQSQIRDALDKLDDHILGCDIKTNVDKYCCYLNKEQFDTINHCLQSALDTQKPAGGAAVGIEYDWKCTCCKTEFKDKKPERDENDNNGGAKCPCCKADGQYTYRSALTMDAVESLKSVLCDPEGKCCISGSDADRKIVDDALAALTGDCGGGDHPQIEGLEAAINNSIMYPMVNDVGFQSEHDRRVVMQAARRYLALTADNAKRGE